VAPTYDIHQALLALLQCPLYTLLLLANELLTPLPLHLLLVLDFRELLRLLEPL